MKSELINFRLPVDIAAALKRAAAEDLRSVNAQGIYYLRKGLLAEARYPSGNADVAPARPAVAVPGRSVPDASPPPSQAPSDRDTGTDVRVALAAISAEIKIEQHRPLGGMSHVALRDLLAQFPDVRDLSSARAHGPKAWVSAGAGPGLISMLFPGDEKAVNAAKKRKNAVQINRKLEAGSEIGRFIAAKGILGRGAQNLRTLLAQHFDGMSIDEAVQQGHDAWLDADVSESVARKVFGEEIALKARRRAYARDNAKKRAAAA